MAGDRKTSVENIVKIHRHSRSQEKNTRYRRIRSERKDICMQEISVYVYLFNVFWILVKVGLAKEIGDLVLVSLAPFCLDPFRYF